MVEEEPDFSWLYVGVAKSVRGCSIFCPCMDDYPGVETLRQTYGDEENETRVIYG